jgi:N-acetylglutamate synthase-like GNAT family acetyltransferase
MASLSDFFDFDGLALRRILPGDFPATVELVNEAYAYQETAKGEPRTSLDQLAARAETSECYVLEAGSKIVGCVYVELLNRKLAKFGMLTVAPALRHKGVGGSLIAAVESYVKGQDIIRLQLDYMSVAPWLKSYYERLGFQENGSIRAWGNIDLIQMEKSFTKP